MHGNGRDVCTTCPYCGVGCGVRARIVGDRIVSVTGDVSHPANLGRLCIKGSSLAETGGLNGRLLVPEIDGQAADWDSAIGAVAQRFARTIAEHGPDSVAFYVSGQLLTEDYYVANKLMKGFIGSANIDTNSRLCMASAVVGHKRAFGMDAVPGCYEDLEQADLIVLVGSNAAWTHPVLHQRMIAAGTDRPSRRIVVIDPRRTATAQGADLHLPLRPGSDAALFNGLLAHLEHAGLISSDARERLDDLSEALAAARPWTPAVVASACDLGIDAVEDFYRMFAATERVVTMFSQGVNQSSSGVDKANAIINCHLASARIGRPGMGPFSITGQPNAMGGREVGGLANQLAAHMDFDEVSKARVQTFWNSPRIAQRPGLKAVDLFDAVAAGRVRALWIMATNPVVSMPDADRVRAAIAGCEFVVVSDIVRSDTARLAHVLLPATGWAEKDGTVTNSERRISRQRACIPAPGQARHDWRIICDVASLMGWAKAFDYDGPAAIFREHAALSAWQNDGSRAFDIGALAGLDGDEYDALEPVQWPVTAAAPHGTARLYGDGRFHRAQGHARMIAIEPRGPARAPESRRPMILNTGRLRDQWHTMTRTGRAPRLFGHADEPFCEIDRRDAHALGIGERALVRIDSDSGWMLARARVIDAPRRGAIFVPMHWSACFASQARMGTLVAPVTDPISGQPESKHAVVRVEPWAADWQGCLVVTGEWADVRPVGASRRTAAAPATIPAVADETALGSGSADPRAPWLDAAAPSLHDLLTRVPYWVRVPGTCATRFELAGRHADGPDDWGDWFAALAPAASVVEACGPAPLPYHAVLWGDDRPVAALYLSPRTPAIDRAAVAALFEHRKPDAAHRLALLAGRAPPGAPPAGRTICACHDVREPAIVSAIRAGAESVAALGRALGCGTGCGSCVPELHGLLGSGRSRGPACSEGGQAGIEPAPALVTAPAPAPKPKTRHLTY
ncbi:MAG: nitrate reductase [Burkholderiaceae bacterium]